MRDGGSWKRVEDFFAEVVDLGADARAERLEAIRKTDPELHTELKSLLEADDEVDERLGDFENLVSEPDFEPLSEVDRFIIIKPGSWGPSM